MEIRTIGKHCWAIVSNASTLYGLTPSSLWAFAAPFALSAAAFMSGIVNGQGLMWALVGGSIVCAATFASLIQFTKWRLMVTMRDKLQIKGVRVSLHHNSDGIKLGIDLESFSDFAMECECVKYYTKIGDRIPVEPPLFAKQNVAPHGGAWFEDSSITVPRPRDAVEGLIEFEFRYGAKGRRLTQSLKTKQVVSIVFDASGAPASVYASTAAS